MIGINPKETAIEIIHGAISDLNYNRPYIGGSKIPFKDSNIQKLFLLKEPYKLSNEVYERIQNYQYNIARSNGDSGKPGLVQHESHQLRAILEDHLFKIKNV